jgi:chromosome segregation ATPase
MADEMNTIPPRLNELEREVHTVKHRLKELEDVHRDTPTRVTKLELAVERLPQIEKQLAEQGEMLKRNFTIVQGMILGAGAVWVVFQAGPELLRFLGAR